VAEGKTINYMDISGPGMNIVRACSEALYFGVVSCFSQESPAH
jgi:hypothetical protein